ncbi:MAG: hypothetical protein ABIE55_02020 [Candidatus Aenigmatarchaeota archaeon]
MGFFSTFIFKNKNGKKFWLHVKIKGKSRIYYFSKDPTGAVRDIPKGYEAIEGPKTGLPFLRKKSGGFLGGFGGKGKVKKDEKPQKEVEKPSEKT